MGAYPTWSFPSVVSTTIWCCQQRALLVDEGILTHSNLLTCALSARM